MNEPWSLPLTIMPGVQGGEYTDVFTPQSAEQAPAGERRVGRNSHR